MKDYIDQFYNEGLATTFHLKPVNWCKKKIKNKKIFKIISIIIKVLYTILVLVFAGYILYEKLPF